MSSEESSEAQIKPLVLQIEELALLTESLIEISRNNENLAELKKYHNEFWKLNDEIKGTLEFCFPHSFLFASKLEHCDVPFLELLISSSEGRKQHFSVKVQYCKKSSHGRF